VVSEDIQEQTVQTLENIASILDAANLTMDDIVKTNVYVTDMSNYNRVNGVYNEFFSDPYPARSAVEVSDLPVDIGVEIEAIAEIPDGSGT
jgi:reactive intermediate/imine deaminase